MNNLLLSRKFLLPCQRITELIQSRFYAKPAGKQNSVKGSKYGSLIHMISFAVPVKAKKVGKGGPIVEKTVLPVERDVNKIVNYVAGSNIYITGEDVKVSQ